MPFVPDNEVKALTDAPRKPRFVPDAPVAAAPSAPAEPPAQPSVAKDIAMAPIGAAEELLKVGTGAVASIPAGVTYGVQAVRKALGADVDPAASMHSVQKTLTYQPMSDSGKAADEAIGETARIVGEPIARGADKLATNVGKVSPTAETLLREAPAAAQAAAGVLPVAGAAGTVTREIGAARSAAKAAATDAAPVVSDAVKDMNAAGYSVRPSDVRATNPGAKVPGIRREGLQDPAALSQDFNLKNQVVTTRDAATDIGAPKKNAIEPGDFDKLRDPHIAKYKETGAAVGKFKASDEFAPSLGAIVNKAGLEPKARRAISAQVKQYNTADMNGPDAIKTVSALRRRATAQLRSQDVATNDAGMANRAIPDAIEAELGRQLTARGETKLLGEFQTARTQLAKIHDVQSVTKNGQVDAIGLRRLEKRGVLLSGRLKRIANAAETAPNVMKHSSRTTGVDGGPSIDSKAGAIKTAGKAVLRKLPGMDIRGEGFQSRAFGRKPTKFEPQYDRPPEPPAGPEPFANVDYTPTSGVVPSRAQTLAGDLGLAPEPVQNPVQLPAAPSRLTAEVPSAVASDGLPFTPSMPLGAQLAPDFPMEPFEGVALPAFMRHRGDVVDWAPPNLADLLLGDGLRVQPPTYTGQAELEAFAPQRPRAQLTPPPGRVGKPKVRPRG